MTDGLYTNKSLFIRELLQNALDALRHRRALYQSEGLEIPDLRVQFEHFQESGFDVVRCCDNGVGMDEAVVTRFLTRAGRSFYRSPEFERERSRFREKGCDFDPCARFGIGFMSCFMFGDEITIRTRRDYGIGLQHGQPMIVEIKGLSGIVVVRPGKSDQPLGTTIELRGRRKSFPVDRWSDPVNLLEVLEGYALAAEFPIEANCQVAPIKGQVVIAPAMSARPHPIEGIDIRSKAVFSVPLSDADPRLRGEIRLCMLTDAAGIPSVANSEGRLEIRRGPSPNSMTTQMVVLADGNEVELSRGRDARQVCCDGILVAGEPGREERLRRLGSYSCNDGFGKAAFLIDARGDLKPHLTPARTPPDPRFREDATWAHLFDTAGRAYANLLDLVAASCAESADPERFWAIAEGYGLDLYHLHLVTLWRQIRFPVMADEGAIEWCAAHDLGHPRLILPIAEKQPSEFHVKNGKTLLLPAAVANLAGEQNSIGTRLMERLLTGISTITAVSTTELELTLHAPPAGTRLADMVFYSGFEWRWYFQCGGDLAQAICITGDHGFSNAAHPVVQQGRLLDHKEWDERSPLERIIGHLTARAVGESFDFEVPSNSWSARIRKILGLLFRAVDWNSVAPPLRPPYLVFRPGQGMEAMTIGHLERWADSTPLPD